MRLVALMESIKSALSTEESLKEFIYKRLAGAKKIQAAAEKIKIQWVSCLL